MNIRICGCGGLAYKCERYGHLPESIGHYRGAEPPMEVTVVWNGTLHRANAAAVQLVPDREEHPDQRLWAMPTYDLDDGEHVETTMTRKYTKSGRYVGVFSRTDPDAPQYLPRSSRWRKGSTVPDAAARPEDQTHG